VSWRHVRVSEYAVSLRTTIARCGGLARGHLEECEQCVHSDVDTNPRSAAVTCLTVTDTYDISYLSSFMLKLDCVRLYSLV